MGDISRGQKKYLYVYKTTLILDGRVYIGQRGCDCLPEDDTYYLGSGSYFNRALKKYGRKNFVKEIIEICTEDTIDDIEDYWIFYFNPTRDKSIGFNLKCKKKKGRKEMCHHPDTIEEIREKILNHPDKEIWREKNISWHKGKKDSEETKKKKSLKSKGRKRPQYVIDATTAKLKGRKQPKEFCEKISTTLKRKYASGEIISKNIGKKHTPEAIELNRQKHIGLIPSNAVSVIVYNILTKETHLVPLIKDCSKYLPELSTNQLSHMREVGNKYKGYYLFYEPKFKELTQSEIDEVVKNARVYETNSNQRVTIVYNILTKEVNSFKGIKGNTYFEDLTRAQIGWIRSEKLIHNNQLAFFEEDFNELSEKKLEIIIKNAKTLDLYHNKKPNILYNIIDNTYQEFEGNPGIKGLTSEQVAWVRKYKFTCNNFMVFYKKDFIELSEEDLNKVIKNSTTYIKGGQKPLIFYNVITNTFIEQNSHKFWDDCDVQKIGWIRTSKRIFRDIIIFYKEDFDKIPKIELEELIKNAKQYKTRTKINARVN